MTRTLFFFTALAAMLAAMTAVLIRIERAYSGASPLFQLAGSDPSGLYLTEITGVHAATSFLAATLLGATMCSAARSKGAFLSGLFVWLGLFLAAAVLVLIALMVLPLPASDASGLGWVAAPELNRRPASLLDALLPLLPDVIYIDPLIDDLTPVLILPAAMMIFLGTYAMLGTLPSFRLLPVLGLVLTIVITVLAAPLVLAENPALMNGLYLAPAFPLLLCASIRLIDTAQTWLMILTLGLILAMFGQITLSVLSTNTFTDGTMVEVAAPYIFPLGIAFFALPALILFDRTTDLSAGATAMALAAITLPLALWLTQLVGLGLNGMLNIDVDLDDVFGGDTLALSANVMFFVVFYLTTLTAIRRATR